MSFLLGFLIISYLRACNQNILYMVKHVILWKLDSKLTEVQREEVKQNIKNGLEALTGRIPGLLDIKVNINPLPTSNVDLMLDSSFESFEALKAYSVHPAHVAVADNLVRPYTIQRSCLDYNPE